MGNYPSCTSGNGGGVRQKGGLKGVRKNTQQPQRGGKIYRVIQQKEPETRGGEEHNTEQRAVNTN